MKKIAKCPRCTPDVAGAVFDRQGPAWVCRCCGTELPVRARRASPRLEAARQRLLVELRGQA
jgi:hypothetical protein